MGDRLAVLNAGRVMQVGTPEVYHAREPVHRGLHRQPGDELLDRPAGRERGWADVRHTQRRAPPAAADCPPA